MKQYKNLIALFFIILITSCENTPQIEKEAKNRLPVVTKNLAKVPESVKLSNINTVYRNDSLCIIHLDFAAKNQIGTETTSICEYIYLKHNYHNFEYFNELDEDSVYQNKKYYEKTKNDKIYRNLDYDMAMRQRAIIAINKSGREITNNTNEEKNVIPVPTGTGTWLLGTYNNEFRENTKDNYIFTVGTGEFSNFLINNAELGIIAYVTKDSLIYFKFFEYVNNLVNDNKEFTMKLKTSQGDIQSFKMYNQKEGEIISDNKEENKKLYNFLKKQEGQIKGYAQMGEFIITTYHFSFNTTGLKNAIKIIQ